MISVSSLLNPESENPEKQSSQHNNSVGDFRDQRGESNSPAPSNTTTPALSLLPPRPQSSASVTASPRKYQHQSSPKKRCNSQLSESVLSRIHAARHGIARYPPHENHDDTALEAAYTEFKVKPLRSTAQSARYIPYSNGLKGFGRCAGNQKGFEVYQFSFVMPEEEKVHTMMWDYNTGFVRTTALFRCLKHAKTAPSKVIDANPGLRRRCYNITGGALAAQGYWTPFNVARAVAASFCWKIRHVLSIVFGYDFVSQCIPPGDPRFGQMTIDPAIVRSNMPVDFEVKKLQHAPQTGGIPCTPDTPVDVVALPPITQIVGALSWPDP